MSQIADEEDKISRTLFEEFICALVSGLEREKLVVQCVTRSSSYPIQSPERAEPGISRRGKVPRTWKGVLAPNRRQKALAIRNPAGKKQQAGGDD
ncbi:hypothetical protein TRV_04751 [Trichophyton verrucosum HKI 0517]|uniref:Uncharacterized protein n=1 Tax=Trichophyton verrucosum (strain HKI 0517) TaxID=663202 RepID=D4DC98_TRIVH|nr:uncharacterized protein TRV_04751 [Trichophyton verrucosum HKI 0517]EFE40518.1 hypothetical protein TRV_04751 [Trichophyton verrucosum HKI 0517]